MRSIILNSYKFNKWILALVILFAGNAASACTCMYMGKFQDYAESNPIVVRATIIRLGKALPNIPEYRESMLVEVTDIYKGSFSNSFLTLQGDSGMSCLKYISAEEFEIGSEFLFSLSNDTNLQGLGGCGESFAKIEGETIQGIERTNGAWAPYSSSLSEIISGISAN